MAKKDITELVKADLKAAEKEETEAWDVLFDETAASSNRNAAILVIQWCQARRSNALNLITSAAQLEMQQKARTGLSL